MSSKLLDIFVKNVKIVLAQKNLTQADLADLLGVSRQTVSQFISGEHEPRISKIGDIAAALKVSPGSLLGAPDSILESRVAALEAKVEAKPSSLIERLVAVARKSDPVDVENMLQTLEDVLAHDLGTQGEHKKGSA